MAKARRLRSPTYPESPRRFFAKVVDITLEFRTDSVILSQGGKAFLYKRVR
jgi:hypothetical protein